MIKSINRLNTTKPHAIGSLKSQLHLRPSYHELLKETLVEDENRPSIEDVIDRKATRYRLNQYGSQWDNKDSLGLLNQETMKRKEELRKAETTASSSRITSRSSSKSAFSTPDSPLTEYEEYENDIQASFEEQDRQVREKREKLSPSIHEDLNKASSSSIPEGVVVHSMTSDDELPPLEPIEETATAKKGKDNDDDDKQTTISDTEIMEMHEKANEMELQNVENEEVDDEQIFKNYLETIKWMWPVYLSKNPGTMMDNIISKLHQFNVINADKYDEFKELLDEYNNASTTERKGIRTQLETYYKDNVYNKYFKQKPSSSTQQ